MHDSSTQLPFELVEIIISEFWFSEHASEDRILFMTACPLISRLWRDVYAYITSRDIYIPTVPYLLYLSSVIRFKRSKIYHHFLPESTLTMTCYVDLTETDKDTAMHPYSVFCSMPSYIGFRKCFPNMKHIHLKISFRIRSDRYPSLYRGQLIRTRLSIGLDKAAALSILPVDWCIAASDAPDIDEVDFNNIRNTWGGFLMDITHDMIQWRWELGNIYGWGSCSPAMRGSTCCEGVRRFQNRNYCPERKGDLWDINYLFSKAARKPMNFKTFFSGIYEDLYWGFNSHIGCEIRVWINILAVGHGGRLQDTKTRTWVNRNTMALVIG
ncbi:uncharacterized protein EV420DRAFT_1155207 [Desarmillaria tabescens]|uniref:Uncharacterized protein n=1 Tax=Armillaria tabescens TaxID=1929756 RepID=A0AA39NCI6_ARMTA|nr:uncharacterized protein EV420DRAFT_1155207 [Desarmillaria tabescens]KAK0463089.1 hypothetical protein EV420DRAFT_1155207 [Desarmillaria tabescens]